ncbi:MAG: hypothetical protein HQL23_03140 [Candidatus Omnitrophica bacterium]|nr:hypothetical protein [Candidatus Omnitrophota bacterium]
MTDLLKWREFGVNFIGIDGGGDMAGIIVVIGGGLAGMMAAVRAAPLICAYYFLRIY